MNSDATDTTLETVNPSHVIGAALLIGSNWYHLQMVGMSSLDTRDILQRRTLGDLLNVWGSGIEGVTSWKTSSILVYAPRG
jgi:hypothetical protein